MRNLRGGLAIPRGALGAYQQRSSTCYSDDRSAGDWVDGLSGWGIDGLTVAARRWRDGETGRGDVVERPPVKDAGAFCWGSL